jgi:hypothetical protein
MGFALIPNNIKQGKMKINDEKNQHMKNYIISKYLLGCIFKTRVCNTNYGHEKNHKSN